MALHKNSVCSLQSGRMNLAQRFIAGRTMIAFSVVNGRLNRNELEESVWSSLSRPFHGLYSLRGATQHSSAGLLAVVR
jgi:hypothetical protein